MRVLPCRGWRKCWQRRQRDPDLQLNLQRKLQLNLLSNLHLSVHP
jgi:hypothetical protein